MEQRVIQYQQHIDDQSVSYRRRQYQQYEIDLLKRLPKKFGNVIPIQDQDAWMRRLEGLVQQLPEANANGTSFVKAKNEILRDLNKKYKLQRKGQWTVIFMPVFMVSIGVSIGSSTGNLALWLPVGMAIGFGVGYMIEKNAEKKGLIL